ncbi:hypothetical protein Tco_0089807 [Tanacetum coccineum]
MIRLCVGDEIEACLISDSIPSGIDGADFDPEGDILLLEKLLNVNISFLFPPKELHFEGLKVIKSYIPPDFEDDYYDSEGDTIYLKSLLINDTIPNLPPEVFFDHDPKSLNDEPDNDDLKNTIKVFDPGGTLPNSFLDCVLSKTLHCVLSKTLHCVLSKILHCVLSKTLHCVLSKTLHCVLSKTLHCVLSKTLHCVLSKTLHCVLPIPKGDALRKCILEGPYQPTTVTIPAVPATENSPEVPERTTVETVSTMSPENKDHYESEKEAIHLILTGIGDEIYSTVDACKTTHEMWEAIERLQQGESLNIQDVKTNLFWEFGKFTSHDGETIESYYTRFYKLMNEMIRNNLTVDKMQVNVQFLQQLQPEWSRFVTIVKQQHKLDEVSYHKFFDILKQYQKEVNELRAKRIAKNANLLALWSQEQAQKIRKCINLASLPKNFKNFYQTYSNNLRPSSKHLNKNVDITPRKSKWVKDSTYHKEKMLLCKHAEKGVQLQVEQSDWLADMDKEIDEQELEAHYRYMENIQEVPNADSSTD